MAFQNIENFIQKFAGGGVRTNLFEVVGNVGPVDGELEQLNFLVRTAQLPASSVGVVEVPFRGRNVKIPGDRSFADWSISVLLDQDFTLRDSFERWSSLINQHVDNSSAFTVQPIGGAGIYQNWQVYSLDRQGIRRKGYNFVGCWPSEIGTVDLNNDPTTGIGEFPVTLTYQYWTTKETTDGNSGELTA